jgi:hypothetical protein
MTTARTIRNRATGDIASPSSHLSGASRLRRRGSLDFFGIRKVTLRGLPRSTRVLPYLVGESDDFESRDRLHWWSYGAFSSKGQLYGNQYLAGRRAPPLLRQQ